MAYNVRMVENPVTVPPGSFVYEDSQIVQVNRVEIAGPNIVYYVTITRADEPPREAVRFNIDLNYALDHASSQNSRR